MKTSITGWMRAAFAVGFAAFVVAAAGCNNASTGGTCSREGDSLCLDTKTELVCQNGKYMASPCKGAKGCFSHEREHLCDVTRNDDGDVCPHAAEGHVACAIDGKNQILCRNGVYRKLPCRGSGGCKVKGGEAHCDESVGAVGDACDHWIETGYACSVDRQSELVCQDSKMVVAQPCRGPKECTVKSDKIYCDNDFARAGDSCVDAGEISCTEDKLAKLSCKAKKFVAVGSCKGSRQCSWRSSSLDCDDSIADVNDLCDKSGNHACSTDRNSVLVCVSGKFAVEAGCGGKRCVARSSTGSSAQAFCSG